MVKRMAITVTRTSSDNFSNQPSDGRAQAPIAKTIKLPNGGICRVTVPFCDRLALTGPVAATQLIAAALESGLQPEDFIRSLVERAHDWLRQSVHAEGWGTITIKRADTGAYRGGSITIASPGERPTAPIVFGVARPAKDASHFKVRIEFSPHNVGRSGVLDFVSVFGAAFGDTVSFEKWLRTAKITRYDAAIDVYGVPLHDMHVRSPLGDKWSGFFSSTGQIETRSQLRRKSKKSTGREPILILYDKRREWMDRTPPPRRVSSTPHVRIERRLRGSKSLFPALAVRPNPFAQVRIGQVSLMADVLGAEWGTFFYDASRRGKYKKLGLPAAWLEAFENPTTEWWDADELWKLWGKGLEADGLIAWIEQAKAP